MKKTLLFKVIFKYIPEILSVILHPLIMPTLGIYIILSTSGTNAYLLEWQDKYLIITLVAIFTFILPISFLPFYYYFKITSTIKLNIRQERIIPLMMTSIVFYICFMLFKIKGAPHLIQYFLLASTLAVFSDLLITLRWHISAHMIGIGGIIGLLLNLALFYHIEILGYLILAILIAGLISFSRLSLDAHTPKQVYSGLLLGLLETFLVNFFYLHPSFSIL
jgi:hypothetical protein